MSSQDSHVSSLASYCNTLTAVHSSSPPMILLILKLTIAVLIKNTTYTYENDIYISIFDVEI